MTSDREARPCRELLLDHLLVPLLKRLPSASLAAAATDGRTTPLPFGRRGASGGASGPSAGGGGELKCLLENVLAVFEDRAPASDADADAWLDFWLLRRAAMKILEQVRTPSRMARSGLLFYF